MEKKKISRKERKEILSKVVFEDFQIKSVQVTIYKRYDKIISTERAICVLRILYFKDAKESLDYLERTYDKRNYYINKRKQ